MTTYFITETRDGQRAKRKGQLFASNMEEAITEFSNNIIRDIAAGSDYSYYGSEADLKASYPDYDWKGAGYYALPDTTTIGREDFYAADTKFDSYREDVYTYGVEEDNE